MRKTIGSVLQNNTFKRILIADHNDHTRRLLSSLLEKKGYSVVTAANGSETLTEIHRHNPHLVLMEIVLPVMDGFDVLRALNEYPNRRAMKIIVISAVTHEAARLKGLTLGVDEYVTKPFSNQPLVKTIETLLENPNG